MVYTHIHQYLHNLERVSFVIKRFQQLKAPVLAHLQFILTSIQVHCICRKAFRVCCCPQSTPTLALSRLRRMDRGIIADLQNEFPAKLYMTSMATCKLIEQYTEMLPR